MPMIDVYLPAGLIPESADAALTTRLALAVLHAEGVATPGPLHLNNTATFLHRLPASALGTAAEPATSAVRIQVITPPAALDREGQRTLTREATSIVAELAGDPTLSARTWVILTEAAEGGWGIGGTAFGREEFGALRTPVAAAAG